METLYDLLGALPNDDAEELRAAFRRAVKGAHPDINPGDPDAALKFRQIVRANDILGDHEQRAAYDHLLDLAKIEHEQESRRAVLSGAVHRLTSGVIAFSAASILVAGGYALLMHLSSPSVASRAAATLAPLKQMAFAAAATEVIDAPAPETTASIEPATVERPAAAGVSDPPATADAVVAPAEPAIKSAATEPPVTESAAVIGPPLDLTVSDARSFRQRGIVAYRNGNLGAAVAEFDQAIQIDPKFAAAYIDRGIVLYRMRKFDRAYADIARARQIERTRTSVSPTTVRRPRPRPPKNEFGILSPEQRRTAGL
jgi:tetratricopeptide (TPR) repeat protein